MSFKWRLYLADGNTFDNNDGEPWESPTFPRVVCISQVGAEPDWPNIVVNGTYYIWRARLGIWTWHDEPLGSILEIMDEPGLVTLRMGKFVTTPTFKAIWKRAREEHPDG